MKNKLIKFKDVHNEWMKDPEFKRLYEASEPEFLLVKSLIDTRLKAGLTQKELAKKIGTRQSVISNLEGGQANPTLGTLRKVAKALGAKVMVTLQ
jgi:DNA-binding XRE family transcriptional regulator